MPPRPRANGAPIDFATAAAHDLRQPLHALAISAATLQRLVALRPDAALAAVANDIDRALAQAQALLDALREAGAPGGAGVPRPVRQPVDVAALLGAVAGDFGPQATQRSLAITVEADLPAAERVAVTDAALLRRLLDNLVGNALKFTGDGGVRLGLARADGEAGMLELTVADTGSGLGPGRTPANGGAPPGWGLGLAIVRQVAGLLDIEVRQYRRPGRGTRVVLRIPAPGAAKAAADDRPTTSAAAAPSSACSGGRPVRRSRRAPGPSSAG